MFLRIVTVALFLIDILGCTAIALLVHLTGFLWIAALLVTVAVLILAPVPENIEEPATINQASSTVHVSVCSSVIHVLVYFMLCGLVLYLYVILV